MRQPTFLTAISGIKKIGTKEPTSPRVSAHWGYLNEPYEDPFPWLSFTNVENRMAMNVIWIKEWEKKGPERLSQAGRQGGREAGKQTDRQTDRQADRRTDRMEDRIGNRQTSENPSCCNTFKIYRRNHGPENTPDDWWSISNHAFDVVHKAAESVKDPNNTHLQDAHDDDGPSSYVVV